MTNDDDVDAFRLRLWSSSSRGKRLEEQQAETSKRDEVWMVIVHVPVDLDERR